MPARTEAAARCWSGCWGTSRGLSLKNIWTAGLTENLLCGCGQEFRSCGFWGAVMDEAFGTCPDDRQVEEMVAVRDGILRMRRLLLRRDRGFAEMLRSILTRPSNHCTLP